MTFIRCLLSINKRTKSEKLEKDKKFSSYKKREIKFDNGKKFIDKISSVTRK